MMEIRRTRRLCLGLLVVLMLIALAGCGSPREDLSKMTPEEEQKVKEQARQYIKEKYHKEFAVKEIFKSRVTGASYDVRGTIQDGKNTPFTVMIEPPKEIRDTYIRRLFSDELKLPIKRLAEQIFDLRLMEDNLICSFRDGMGAKYTGEIPSVFEVLKKGDKALYFQVNLEVYEKSDQAQKEISNFLQSLKEMNFHEVTVVVYVYDNRLKSAPKKEDADKYLLYRYNITPDDIQTIDINNLEPYKTKIKE
ncbi:hypothetical protein [Thermoactinomyces sp. DSM 45892]|uniref:hypothetical protein n=1 Tax=Thermoactinomyces sp. DSM 45892 TaxID=1882753 RepID=UPI000896A23B|nr:hypothetical protein [Thermoactinomyces sp. DSM 45892]SDZ00512.1 hypothetical protein SAMN05444416_11196 [Thermoactinomyces sp. DSM 45892]